MKIRKFILLAILSLVALFSCKKDTDPNVATFKIVKETEKVVVGTTEATISGTYEYPGKINSIKVRIGTDPQLFGSDLYATEVIGKAYSVHVTDLRTGTAYYYRYEVDYGANEDFLTEISDFTTLSEAPTVKILSIEVLNNDSTSFGITCEVEDDGGAEVTECGICWNNYPNGNPTLDDEKQTYTGEYNPYFIKMENLPTRTFYHVRAYAKSSAGTGFSEKESFRTGGEATTPKVSTVEVSGVTFNSASCLCNVSSDGGLELIERGVCWGLEPDPTVNKVQAEGTEIGNYTVTIQGLNPNTDYHVRAYAINNKGISYGEDLPFETTDGKPTVTTLGITDITATSAKGGGEVTDQGVSPVTERGICWSTSHEPMATGNHATNGTGVGSYTCNMTNLTPNQTYYVRAYATNTQGTAYGAEVEFTAKEGLPSVLTLDVTDVAATTAKAHGKVTDQGGSPVTERGICWGTEPSPTIDGSHAYSGTGAGEFEISMTNLSPGTTYYVRAYAKNSQGMTYGAEITFTTEATLPTVVTGDVAGTIAQGNVTDDGGAPVTERGICWSLSHNPTTADTHNSAGPGIGEYTVKLNDLEPGKTYYYRAYATNSKGTAYGGEKSLTTEANLPTVITGNVSNIGQNSAVGSGNVTANGGATVTERGVCWSTSHTPTISDSHDTSGTGTGSFTVNMSGLAANTQYYVRAYAKNSAGIAYGAEVNFRTSQNISDPTVTTTPVTNITQTSATGGGNVTDDGGADVIERGICWSTSHNPTTSGNHANNGTGTGSYTVSMTGLTAGTTYYVRAYAINDHRGTSYGNELSFNTEQPTTYTISVSANPSNGGTVSGGGTYNQGASCTVTAIANSNYTFTNWTEGSTVVSTNANYTFAVTGNRSLVANFTSQPQVPQGAINGRFTINANGDQVYFSKGNLQYNKTTQVWSFMDHQYDVVETLGQYVGENYENQNIVSLFGWGTSGYNHGADCYQPWSTSIYNSDYYAYGNWQYNLYDQNGQADWGYNSISGTTGSWRTLTGWIDYTNTGEWDYVFNQRVTSSNILYAKAQVNGVNGVILLPDDWDSSTYSLNNTNYSGASFNSNTISATQWTTLEDAGAVFLPAAGYRGGSSVDYYDYDATFGYYWSASYYDGNYACYVHFGYRGLYTDYSGHRSYGFTVRLVSPCQ